MNTREMTREELIAAATKVHDREGCGCEPKYLMSCPRLVNAILRLPSTPEDDEVADFRAAS